MLILNAGQHFVNDVRILCVDDVADNIKLLAAELEDEGYQVLSASDGESALEVLRSESVDAVILDVMMPGISGFEVLDRVRSERSALDLPILMATALSDVENVISALSRGANDYVVKPLDMDIVLARLRTHLELARLSREKDALSRQRDEFVAIASHDLKNPLGVVLGMTKLVCHMVGPDQPLTDEPRELLGRVVLAAGRMQRIVEDFLDFQILEDGDIELRRDATDINALVREVVDGNTERAREKQIDLGVELTADLDTIKVDGPRITQVLDNLIANAVKFCRAADEVRVRTVRTGEGVRVEVVDSGPGLSQVDLGKVFGKYVRLSNAPTAGERSSGLGLYICRSLVESHSGRIGVQNNEASAGATFWIELPGG